MDDLTKKCIKCGRWHHKAYTKCSACGWRLVETYGLKQRRINLILSWVKQGEGMGLFNFGSPAVDPKQWCAQTVAGIMGNDWADSIKNEYNNLTETATLGFDEDIFYCEYIGAILAVLKFSGDIASKKLGEIIDYHILGNVADKRVTNAYIEYSRIKTGMLGNRHSVVAIRCGDITSQIFVRLSIQNLIPVEYFSKNIQSFSALCEEWLAWIDKLKLGTA
jgi:hypothetical protein